MTIFPSSPCPPWCCCTGSPSLQSPIQWQPNACYPNSSNTATPCESHSPYQLQSHVMGQNTHCLNNSLCLTAHMQCVICGGHVLNDYTRPCWIKPDLCSQKIKHLVFVDSRKPIMCCIGCKFVYWFLI